MQTMTRIADESTEASESEIPSPKSIEHLLRMDRMPHIWCPGCGIGIAVKAFAVALEQAQVPQDDVAVVSGIGCTGRVAGYVKLDSFHTTHGRPIPFATGLHLANPKLRVVVFSGEGDLIGIGGNHFIHAARRNVDLTVICVNNFNYAMTGGQVSPGTPLTARLRTSPYGNYEHPFSLPALAASSGAVYVARWNVLHVRRLAKAMAEALNKRGFSFVEVITPCPTLFSRLNRLGAGLDMMKFFHDNTIIENGADPNKVDIGFQGKVVCGKFVDIEKPTFLDCMNQRLEQVLGAKYERYEGVTASLV